MHEFFGLGTTHFTEVDNVSGAKEVIKQRVHSLLIKNHNGRACAYWKQFMRDDIWQPEDGVGWPIFKDNVDLDLSALKAMPTKPITGLVEVEKRVKVSCTPPKASVRVQDKLFKTNTNNIIPVCYTGLYKTVGELARRNPNT